MKTRIATLFLFALWPFVEVSSQAQGTFQNLDFESANIPNGTQPGPITVLNALPGWNVFYGLSEQSQISYNDISLGSSQVTLVSANDPFGPNCIEGNFGVFLQGGSTAADVSIRQSSLVPVLTQSIFFKGQSFGPMFLSLGGQNVPFIALSNGQNYTLYGASIPTALTGQVEELKFSVPEGVGGNNAWNIDSIVFSSNQIPEPGIWALLTLGTAVFTARLSRHKR